MGVQRASSGNLSLFEGADVPGLKEWNWVLGAIGRCISAFLIAALVCTFHIAISYSCNILQMTENMIKYAHFIWHS
jgi:hypothetical protein